MSNELVLHEATKDAALELMPLLSVAQMTARYNALVELAKGIMKEGKDYGKIPGTDKPTLLKAGAEKLCTMFGLRPIFTCSDKIEDWESGLFYYRYKCELLRGESILATSEGSCNSREKKYRYRTVYPDKATEQEKQVGRLEKRKGKNNSTYSVYVIENNEPFDLINTFQKMAQKRALVAAVLIATNASEFYTQDVEDMEVIDVDYVEVVPTPPKPPPAQVAPTPMENGEPWQMWRSQNDAIAWADSLKVNGQLLFRHKKHVENFYNQQRESYMNSLEGKKPMALEAFRFFYEACMDRLNSPFEPIGEEESLEYGAL